MKDINWVKADIGLRDNEIIVTDNIKKIGNSINIIINSLVATKMLMRNNAVTDSKFRSSVIRNLEQQKESLEDIVKDFFI